MRAFIQKNLQVIWLRIHYFTTEIKFRNLVLVKIALDLNLYHGQNIRTTSKLPWGWLLWSYRYTVGTLDQAKVLVNPL
jgi:hypothetical protein